MIYNEKKILLLFSLLLVPNVAVNTTSCFFNKKGTTETGLTDISAKTFNDVDVSNVNTGDLLYSEVRTQIGSWANPIVDSSDIKNDDTKIILIIMSSGSNTTEIDDSPNAVVASGDNRVIKIAVSDNDEYFKAQEEADYSINIKNGLEDISTKNFNNVVVKDVVIGNLLYN